MLLKDKERKNLIKQASKKINRGTLATKLETTRNVVDMILSLNCNCSGPRAKKIESLTKRVIKAKWLRPDIFGNGK